jgi:hypothetical protein
MYPLQGGGELGGGGVVDNADGDVRHVGELRLGRTGEDDEGVGWLGGEAVEVEEGVEEDEAEVGGCAGEGEVYHFVLIEANR